MGKERTWSKRIEELGIKIRLFERAKANAVFFDYTRPDGTRVRKSTKTSDRDEAEQEVRRAARELVPSLSLATKTMRSPCPRFAEARRKTVPSSSQCSGQQRKMRLGWPKA